MTDTTPTFHDVGVDATLADALASKGIVHPFPIQELTLPMALKGADLIGQARTGTGKTLAFGLPLLQRIDPDLPKTQALVIVPTRELCLQVADDLTVGSARGISSIAIYGGVGYDEQIDALTNGVHVVIGTPGRTLDHLNRGNLDLSNVHVVVLDEADEMLDMGFLPDVERLLTGVPEDRQTLLFSATMPAVIVKLARRFMSKPTFMRAEAEERETAPTVDQHFFLVHRMDKPRVLARILQSDERGGAFVFTRTKNMADRLVRELEDLHVSAIAVHGDLRQTTREKNLDRFRAGKADVLVATEVAARGLDVDNVTHVFNYDCPDDEKMYLHRIGRTARAGNRGVAVTFAEFNEVDRLNVIRKAVQADDEVREVFSTSDVLTELFELPAETPWDHMARGGANGSSRGGSSRSGGGRSSSGTDEDRRSSRRRSSSDGRNKSRRGSDGSRPASRDRRDRSTDEGQDRGPQERPASDDGDTTSSSSRGRTRTRTRSRDRSSSRTDTSGGTSSSSSTKTSSKDDDSGSSSDRRSSSSGRTRARTSRSRSGSSGRDGGDDSSSTKTSSKDASGKGSSGKESSGKDSSAKGSSGTDSSRGGSSRGGSSRGGSSRSSSGGGGSRSKRESASGSSRNAGRSGGGRSNNGAGGDGTVQTTRRGEPARGDGTPRPRRRVQVDHLP